MTRPVVIVDPVDSGAELAPAFAARGVPAVAVRSIPGALWDEVHEVGFAADVRADHFVAQYEVGPALVTQLRAHHPLAVVAGAESGVELADQLAAALTPALANDPARTRARRHKGAMQAAIAAAGLPHIRTLDTADPAEVEVWLAREGLGTSALVVKPAASAGSDNVHHVRPGGDWRTPFQRVLASRTKLRAEANETVIVQEQVVGTEYAVDTVSAGGDHVLAHLIRYAKTSAGDRMTVFDHTEFVAFDERAHGQLLAYVRQVLDALGIRWGAAHCEVMVTRDGPRMIEVGARTCGGPVLGFSRVATGSSQLERVVEAYLDGAIHTRAYELQRTVMPVFLIAPRSGVLGNVEALAPLRDLPTHLGTHMWLGNGDHVPQTVDFDTALGIVGLAGEREAVLADYRRVREAEAELRIEPEA